MRKKANKCKFEYRECSADVAKIKLQITLEQFINKFWTFKNNGDAF
jgi:hypothetical protein